MTSIKEMGKSSNGNDKVEVDIGNISGVKGKSKAGNPTIRLTGSHVIDGKTHYLTGNLTCTE